MPRFYLLSLKARLGQLIEMRISPLRNTKSLLSPHSPIFSLQAAPPHPQAAPPNPKTKLSLLLSLSCKDGFHKRASVSRSPILQKPIKTVHGYAIEIHRLTLLYIKSTILMSREIIKNYRMLENSRLEPLQKAQLLHL